MFGGALGAKNRLYLIYVYVYVYIYSLIYLTKNPITYPLFNYYQ